MKSADAVLMLGRRRRRRRLKQLLSQIFTKKNLGKQCVSVNFSAVKPKATELVEIRLECSF